MNDSATSRPGLIEEWVGVYLRLGLASAFLVSVYGRIGAARWEGFLGWVGQLTPYLPDVLTPFAAVTATTLEILFGLLLIPGYRTREVGFGSGVLLFAFAVSMMFGEGGWRAPFWYSVFTASAAGFALSTMGVTRWSVDGLRS